MAIAKSEPGKIYTLYFDGVDDFAALGTAPGLHLAGQSFTVEAWIKLERDAPDFFPILGTDETTNDLGLHLCVVDMQPHLGFFANDTRGQSILSAGAWTHLAFCFDANYGTQAIYVNGMLDNVTDGHGPFHGTGTVNMGRFGGIHHFQGNIADLRIWNRSLDRWEIFSRMHTRIKEADAVQLDGLFGYWPLKKTARNVMVAGNSIDVEQVTLRPAPNGGIQVPGAIPTFSSPTEHLRIVHRQEFDFHLENDFTIEAWFALDEFTESNDQIGIVTKRADSGNFPFSIQCLANGRVLCYRDESSSPVLESQEPIGPGLHHVAFSKSGPSLGLYINGELVNQAPDRATGRVNNNAGILIGNFYGSSEVTRQVTEVRIWNVGRNPEQIARRHAERLSGAEEGLIGYWPLEDSAGGVGRDGIPRQSVQLNGPEWRQDSPPLLPPGLDPRPTTVAINFDGGGDHIAFETPEASGLDFPDGFTVEAWVRPQGSGDLHVFPVLSSHGPATGFELRCATGGAELMVTLDRHHQGVAAHEELDSEGWYHVAGVFDGELMSLYVNGVMLATEMASGTFTPCRDQVRIGQNVSWSDRQFLGQLADVRLWRRPRSQQEILHDMYRRILPEEHQGLLAYWTLDGLKQNQIFDQSSPPRLNGRLEGATLISADLPPRLPRGVAAGVKIEELTPGEKKLVQRQRDLEQVLAAKDKEIETRATEIANLEKTVGQLKETLAESQRKLEEFESQVEDLEQDKQKLADVEEQVRQQREEAGAVSLELFIKNTRAQIEQARKAMADGGGNYSLGNVSMELQMVPAPDGGAAIFPGKDELKDVQGALSKLTLNFDEERPPEPTKPTTVTVPDVTKQTEALARRSLTEAGLIVEAHYEAITSADSQMEGRVASQHPAAGDQVERNSTVSVFVGKMS